MSDMKYVLIFSLFLSSYIQAESCYPLYEQKSQEIQQKYGYKEEVGGRWDTSFGQIRWIPGMKIDANINNWAEDFILAVKSGPAIGAFEKSEKERLEWLEAFRKSIKDECKLSKNNYEHLNYMLNELMEDGSFCPGNKIIDPGFFESKSLFKKVLMEAVSSGRFADICKKDIAINDNPSREKGIVKNKSSQKGPSSSKASPK